jgi:hypothetical protein
MPSLPSAVVSSAYSRWCSHFSVGTCSHHQRWLPSPPAPRDPPGPIRSRPHGPSQKAVPHRKARHTDRRLSANIGHGGSRLSECVGTLFHPVIRTSASRWQRAHASRSCPSRASHSGKLTIRTIPSPRLSIPMLSACVRSTRTALPLVEEVHDTRHGFRCQNEHSAGRTVVDVAHQFSQIEHG